MTFADNLFAFALTALAMEITPGPNMTYLAVMAGTRGRKAGFAAVAGIALGLLIIGVLAAVGAAGLIEQAPIVYQALRYGGALYLLWLAYDLWRGTPESEDATEALSFRDGLVTNLLNPKAAAFYLAVMPQFIADPAQALVQGLILTLVYVAVASSIHCGIVLAGSQIQRLIGDPSKAGLIRALAAASLVVVAIWFLWSTRLA